MESPRVRMDDGIGLGYDCYIPGGFIAFVLCSLRVRRMKIDEK
jgi:hypothetical protein